MEQDRQSKTVVVMHTQIKLRSSTERVSALMDGQLPQGELGAVIGALSADDEARECWQVYHLIGDVLRSPDLVRYGRDAGLAQRVAAAIANEPVAQVPPMPASLPKAQASYVDRPAANDGVFRWKMVAGLASFAAVAAVGWTMVAGIGPQSGAEPQLARNTTPAQMPSQVLAVAAPVQAAASATDVDPVAPVMLRDARLDELLAAHRQAAGGSGLGGASGFLRNATFEGHGR